MIERLTALRMYLESMDPRKFYILVGLLAGVFIAVCSFLIYRYYSDVRYYQQKTLVINKKREEVRDILTRLKQVKRQQAEVDTLLERDRDFRIGGYFNDVIVKLGIAKNKTRDPETSQQVLENGYTEVALSASFSNFTMQNLTDLLMTIEQNERIFIKELDIFQSEGNKTINVTLVIATLEPKAEIAP